MDKGMANANARRIYVEKARRKREARFEDFRDLVASGVAPCDAAVRVGSTAVALSRQAYRWQALDIARALNPETLRARRAS